MPLLKKIETDTECVEKGRLWTDYILHFSSALLIRKMDIGKMIVSFDVLVAMIHYTAFQLAAGETSRLVQSSGEPADFETIPHCDKYFFFTQNEKLEVTVDFLAQQETIEFI